MVEAFADRFNVTIDYLQGRDDNSIYYLSPEVAKIAQDIHENKYLKELFDLAHHIIELLYMRNMKKPIT